MLNNFTKLFFSIVAFCSPLSVLAVSGSTLVTEFPNPLGNNINSIPKFVEVVIDKVVLPFGSVIVVLMIIWAGFLFVTAQGNDTKLSKAKNAFMYSVIGTVILLGSWVIASTIKETVCLLYGNNPPSSLDCGN